MKIGQFVQYHMRRVYENKMLSEEEIKNLQDKTYSKKVFNQNFEVLRDVTLDTKDASGRNRYYTNETFFGNCHLTSQWFEYHWNAYLEWLRKIEANNSQKSLNPKSTL